MNKLKKIIESAAWGPLSVVGLVALGAFFFPRLYWDSSYFLVRDNQSTNYPMFAYVAENLRYLGQFPNWVFTNQGGVWIEPLTNNYLTLLPNRILGYFFAWFTQFPLSLIYKWTVLWFGQGLYLIGIFSLAKKFWPNERTPWFLVAAALTSSLTLGILHQEQVLGTVIYLPYLWFSLLATREKSANLMWLGAILGLTFNTQYPQLFMLYFLALLWAACFSPRESAGFLQSTLIPFFRRENAKWILLAGVFFVVGCSPLLYAVLKYKDLLYSPFRAQASGIEVPSYEAYLKLHAIRFTSLQLSDIPFFFQSFVPTGMRFLDDKICFVGPAALLAILLSPIVRFPFRGFQWALVGILLFFSLGVHLEAARLLWYFLPGIGLFRQWYHLAPILIPHFLVLIFFVLRGFLKMEEFSVRQAAYLAIAAVVLFFCSALGLIPVWHGVLPAFLILGKLYQARVFPTFDFLFRAILGIWFLIGNLLWAVPTIREALTFQDPTEITTPPEGYRTDRQKLASAIWREGYPIRSLANPKGVPVFDVVREFRRGGVQWRMADGSLKVVEPHELTIDFDDGEFTFKAHQMPVLATGLTLFQFNDGRWRLPAAQTDSPFLQLKIESGQTVRVSREKSLWAILIKLCWVPLLGLGLAAAFPLKISSTGTASESA